MITNILMFVGGLALLVKGSDIFVKSAASAAKKLGVSEFIIGLTLIAIGTSLPELASGITASLKKASGLVIGNVVGSNMANIGYIIGFAASIWMIKTDEDMLKRDGYIMLFAALLLYAFAFNGTISRIEAAVLLLVYVAYVIFLVEMSSKRKGKYHFKEFIRYFYRLEYLSTIKGNIIATLNDKSGSRPGKLKMGELYRMGMLKDVILLGLGGCAVVIGAKYLIEQALYFAALFKIPNTIIGMTVIAMGTTLPEMAVSITAARKGYGNLVIGNVIGSNIANVCLIIGVSGLISPLTLLRPTLTYAIPFMILMSTLLLVFLKSDWELRRIEGISFCLLYLILMSILIFIGYT